MDEDGKLEALEVTTLTSASDRFANFATWLQIVRAGDDRASSKSFSAGGPEGGRAGDSGLHQAATAVEEVHHAEEFQ
jgi:hypothetical protein